jgi:mRNA-degrading endonuclease RelE of RelBE toxin-antitoxin system
VTYYSDLWSGAAQRQLAALPSAIQDQVDACVRDICRDPHTAGEALLGQAPRQWYGAQAGLAVVVYEIDELGELVHILRVAYRG